MAALNDELGVFRDWLCTADVRRVLGQGRQVVVHVPPGAQVIVEEDDVALHLKLIKIKLAFLCFFATIYRN